MTVVTLQPAIKHKRKHRAVRPQLLTRALLRREELGHRSATARAAQKLFNQIVADLSGGEGSDSLSALELSLVEGAVGAALMIQHFNARLILLKPGEAIDTAAFSSVLTSLSRVAGQLGLRRKAKEIVTPSLSEYLDARKQEGGG